MNYWLIKSEAACYSIDDLARDTERAGSVPWTGIRNFQARNFMRDGMKIGDRAFFYHSNGTPGAPAGIYGIAKIVSTPHPDETALDPKDEHYDPKAAKYAAEGKEPLWVCVDMAFVKKLPRPLSLAEIKNDRVLRDMAVARPGQRLSVMPVTESEWKRAEEVAKKARPSGL